VGSTSATEDGNEYTPGGTVAQNRPRRSSKPAERYEPKREPKRVASGPSDSRKRARGGGGGGGGGGRGGGSTSVRGGASFRSFGACVAMGCGRCGVENHSLLPLPLCDDHCRRHARLAIDGWPKAVDGTDDACRLCCGLDLDAGDKVSFFRKVKGGLMVTSRGRCHPVSSPALLRSWVSSYSSSH